MQRITKKTMLVALLILSIRPVRAADSADVNRQMEDSVAAIVNDKVITAQEVYTILEPEKARLQDLYQNQPTKFNAEFSKLRTAALESLIERQLILSDYKNAGFNIPESYIDDQFQQDIINRFGDRVTFIKTLQKQGQTYEEAKKDFRDNLIILIMSQQKIKGQITVSPYKIEQYYRAHQDKYSEEDQVKLRMIIVPAQSKTDQAAIDKARDICRQIIAGASFEEMAKKYSVGVQAKDGGMMDWNSRKELRRELVEPAFSLKPGSVSDPVITDDAIFILKVEENKKAHVRPLSEVRDEIEQTLKAEESAQRRKQWIDGIRQKSFVRLF